MPLEQIIRERIINEGPLSFRDFMEMALYYPGYGYYTSDREKIGTSGDFYTSSNVSPAFGAMIARQLLEMKTLLNVPDFTVIEYGAGNGTLCLQILDYIKIHAPQETVRYVIIEKSPFLREVQRKLLGQRISWVEDIGDLSPVSGCVLSNELVDNFSVHQVFMKEKLMEVFVDYNNGFVEVLRPASMALQQYFNNLKVTLPAGFRTEVCLEVEGWLKGISRSMETGFVMTIDYGGTSADLYASIRRLGTLVAYHKHQVSDNLYVNVGAQDITAHVNFSALALIGHGYGLEFTGYRDQGSFLRALGFENYLITLRPPGEEYLAQAGREEFVAHTLLEDMGKKFKVLIQQKNVPPVALQGLRSL
jgi:SAM-dependent MidA family methyltransferase